MFTVVYPLVVRVLPREPALGNIRRRLALL